MSMAQLVAAGAPELPEDMFYRVKDTSIRSVKVQVRRRMRFGSRCLAEAYVLHTIYRTGEVALVAACTMAHERWSGRDEVRARYAHARAFIGDHDPKGGK